MPLGWHNCQCRYVLLRGILCLRSVNKAFELQPTLQSFDYTDTTKVFLGSGWGSSTIPLACLSVCLSGSCATCSCRQQVVTQAQSPGTLLSSWSRRMELCLAGQPAVCMNTWLLLVYATSLMHHNHKIIIVTMLSSS